MKRLSGWSTPHPTLRCHRCLCQATRSCLMAGNRAPPSWSQISQDFLSLCKLKDPVQGRHTCHQGGRQGSKEGSWLASSTQEVRGEETSATFPLPEEQSRWQFGIDFTPMRSSPKPSQWHCSTMSFNTSALCKMLSDIIYSALLGDSFLSFLLSCQEDMLIPDGPAHLALSKQCKLLSEQRLNSKLML